MKYIPIISIVAVTIVFLVFITVQISRFNDPTYLEIPEVRTEATKIHERETISLIKEKEECVAQGGRFEARPTFLTTFRTREEMENFSQDYSKMTLRCVRPSEVIFEIAI